MSPPPPPDPADTPADEPFPIPSSVPWWRNRRRWFYLALAALPVGMWPAWEWWYWVDFPMPGAEPAILALASSPSPTADPVSATYLELVNQWRTSLWEWKIGRETNHLKLAGTQWRDAEHGVILKFQTDGRLDWEFEKGWD
ncbi:MAG: hypothetical protein KDL87_18235, partial [Verrucomicrobiae bacterium]|nr:hypothetical protein [Verrucomicrobiae bacterium]